MRTLAFPAFARRLLLSVFACLFCFNYAAAAPVALNIPAQSASDALTAFSKQSGIDVLFPSKELKKVQSQAVVGKFEPDTAIEMLLKDTGFTAARDDKKFVVKSTAPEVTTGSVKGSLTGEGGKGLANVLVAIRETSQSTETDRYGVYIFPNVAAGTYVLVASAPGYQTMHITDVQVRAGRELTLGKEDMRRASEGPLALEPFVVHADTVEQLEKFEVTGSKQQPFTNGNMDITRTINDAQPYYIFDAKTIDQSGAINVEDFLKQRLTMNTVAQTNAQMSGAGGIMGNTSSINLRGLGTDKTLVLVNGRRVAGVAYGTTSFQPDLNGIPLSAIDRIEVLPSSASGIYGGSAIGGVVNVILKRDYSGGEIRASYDTPLDTDAPSRHLFASYGLALEGGKTHVLLNASWSDSSSLLLQDRRKIFEANVATIQRNAPTFFYSNSSPWLGALPNITPSTLAVTTLVLKNGTSLNSRNTFVPAGTSPSIPNPDLNASLLANAGNWDFNLPPTTQSPTGLLEPFGVTPKSKSFQASVRRQMTPWLEAFADFYYTGNKSDSINNPFNAVLTVPASTSSKPSADPFTTPVKIRFPSSFEVPLTSGSTTRSATFGLVAQIPHDWTAELDYTWSENRFNFLIHSVDSAAMAADLASGALNPFVDTLRFPLPLDKYLTSHPYSGSSTTQDIAVRGAGPLPALPWGSPTLTVGLESLIGRTPANIDELSFPISINSDSITTIYARKSVTDSIYAEGIIPLIRRDWLPAVHTLDLQVSGRGERTAVDSGTTGESFFPNRVPNLEYNGPTLNGQSFSARTNYTSTNYTVGFKYQPVADLTIRASLATAFLPPTPDQLVANPQTDSVLYGSLTTIIDPRSGNSVDVDTLSGGSPTLKPQHSKSTNVGIIWEPHWKPLQGLRLNAEYYQINQFDYITSLDAQTIVNEESTFPDRVKRDSSGTITLVDISLMNLYHLETEGWDLSADYTCETRFGTFNLQAMESVILHLKTQYSQTLPEYEAAGYSPGEGGAAKYKGNAVLTWTWRNWTAGWATTYFGSYKEYGAAGGPYSEQYANGRTYLSLVATQGSDTIPAQLYHDVFVGYAFGKRKAASGSQWTTAGSRLASGLTVQLGVRNIFDKVPPFDAFYSNNHYQSPYGSMRLRSYWVNLTKAF